MEMYQKELLTIQCRPTAAFQRDSSVLIIFDNKLYNSLGSGHLELMNTTLLDTARYEMTIYGNSKVQPGKEYPGLPRKAKAMNMILIYGQFGLSVFRHKKSKSGEPLPD